MERLPLAVWFMTLREIFTDTPSTVGIKAAAITVAA
jgi:hypothetical protein